jgi:hypothetical protein
MATKKMPSQQGRGDQPRRESQEDQGMVAQVGPLEVDIPHSIGYYGAIGLAVALEIIEPPVGLFIAAVPLFKLLKQRGEPAPTRFVGAILEGAAKPVGGDAEAVIRLAPAQEPTEEQQGLEG